jgi:hypothetical protein
VIKDSYKGALSLSLSPSFFLSHYLSLCLTIQLAMYHVFLLDVALFSYSIQFIDNSNARFFHIDEGHISGVAFGLQKDSGPFVY